MSVLEDFVQVVDEACLVRMIFLALVGTLLVCTLASCGTTG